MQITPEARQELIICSLQWPNYAVDTFYLLYILIHNITSAPNSISVSINTAVWIVM